MPRKKSIDKPSVSNPETAAVPAPKPARAPRQAAAAVTHKHKKTTPPTVETTTVPQAGQTAAPAAPAHEDIAIRAYLIAESRGFHGGCPEDDWFRAERELAAEPQPNLE